MSPRTDPPRRAEVHLWVIDLDVPGADVAVLDPEEAEPIARLRRPLDRARSGAAHAGARVILGAYLRCPPTCGMGIADGLDGWDADSAPPAGWRPGHVPPAVERPTAERDPGDGWSVRDLPPSGHVAASATAGARELRRLRVPPEVAR
jgi:hypothetical protein